MRLASLAQVVVLPVPLTPTIETTVTPSARAVRAEFMPPRLRSTSAMAMSTKSKPDLPWVSKAFRTAAKICCVMGSPRSAANKAASSSSTLCAVSFGERVTIRWIS